MRVEERDGDFPIVSLCLWEKYRPVDGKGKGSKLGHMTISQFKTSLSYLVRSYLGWRKI